MATDVTYRCPMCRELIKSHRTIDGHQQPPDTWNNCCSPECGQQADGYFQALGRYGTTEDINTDPVGQQYRWNRWEHERLFLLEEERRRDCDHEFVRVMGTAIASTFLDDEDETMETKEYTLLGCRKCGTNKAGDLIRTRTRSKP